MDLTDPQQMNGYTYGNNNPPTFSDPDDKTAHREYEFGIPMKTAMRSALH